MGPGFSAACDMMQARGESLRVASKSRGAQRTNSTYQASGNPLRPSSCAKSLIRSGKGGLEGTERRETFEGTREKAAEAARPGTNVEGWWCVRQRGGWKHARGRAIGTGRTCLLCLRPGDETFP